MWRLGWRRHTAFRVLAAQMLNEEVSVRTMPTQNGSRRRNRPESRSFRVAEGREIVIEATRRPHDILPEKASKEPSQCSSSGASS